VPLVLDVLLGVLTLVLVLPVSLVSLECLVALLPVRPRVRRQTTLEVPRLAVVVPAHNEATVIQATLAHIRAQLRCDDQLLVVADNCTDETARVARLAGATVVERHDQTLRGKGHALAFAREQLDIAPPEVVIVVDADCVPAAHAIPRLARCSWGADRPAQATYLIRAPESGSATQRVAQFAVTVKNLVRPLGATRLGLPCQLAGSGMAFPWHIFRGAPLASSHLVEDLQLGLDLSRAGHAPVFCPEATVFSQFPASAEGQKSQRTRWEHGHLDTILKAGPPMLSRAIGSMRLSCLFLAADMMVPPLSLLILVLLVQVAASSAAFLWGQRILWLLAGLASLGLLSLALVGAWACYARRFLPARILLSIPVFLLAKLPVYARFVLDKQKTWVRTDRRQ
jgi:cellulose synthase/poly-beta-1,6-N-acetylglucosamine synthase-like glycosyltransferase